ncbi:MAG: FtsQ-type POTRA domain-containing protein [Cellvibrionaceae bacterium]
MILTDMKGRASRSAKTREQSRRDKASGVIKRSATDKDQKNTKRNSTKHDSRIESKPVVRQRTTKNNTRRHVINESTVMDRLRLALDVFLKLFLVVGIASVVGVSIYFGKNFVDDASSRPVNTMSVQGDFSFLTQKEVSQIVLPMIENGFLRLPLSGIKDLLEENPWIDSASVSRRWPDKLAVSVVEQDPIARWGNKGFLNLRGEFIALDLDGQLTELPVLSGNEGQEKLIMQDYQQLAQLLRSFGLKVSEFHCDELMSRRVVLDNDLVVNIGRHQLMEKIQRFLTVYNASLKTQLNEITSIDLRYGNGVAVEWKSLEERIQSEISNVISEKQRVIKKNNKA